MIYSETRLVYSLLELRNPQLFEDTQQWEKSVARLDMAIVIAGAPGDNRLDRILDTIEHIQAAHLPILEGVVPSDKEPATPGTDEISVNVSNLSPKIIPSIPPPSMSGFRKMAATPFILPGFLKDWPALTNHYWGSVSYLLQVTGRGRVVPVEIGEDYRQANWTQRIMHWESFLRGIGMLPSKINTDEAPQGQTTILYLAQHNLLTQFPKLRSDILIPDYAYSSPVPPPCFPSYKPPGNEEQLVINAWLGPKGTTSPAHTDPYFNCYCQVLGRKTVWLAPPFQEEMYPFSDPSAPHTTRITSNESSKGSLASESSGDNMGNTSRVDVFDATADQEYPLFGSVVRPQSFCAVLEPGDMLYIPPGWWHAMRSEDISFSVSIWF
ncbi:hypothetical protein M422DRAFT_150086 [Sphaerobolus stellatus SS14]|nr:hypothetical protein M422DRAFT_150086 [Sphaerobolus stellatus SS14]